VESNKLVLLFFISQSQEVVTNSWLSHIWCHQ